MMVQPHRRFRPWCTLLPFAARAEGASLQLRASVGEAVSQPREAGAERIGRCARTLRRNANSTGAGRRHCSPRERGEAWNRTRAPMRVRTHRRGARVAVHPQSRLIGCFHGPGLI
jgi:hypothetical protein